jgi:uncharacterized protein YhbP (UPF0306 family)
MNKKQLNHILATCVRVEIEPNTDRIFLVFEIKDERLKRLVKEDWTQDIDLKLLGKDLVEDEI